MARTGKIKRNRAHRRGGKRKGAGRPPKGITQAKRNIAAMVLAGLPEEEAWTWLLDSCKKADDRRTFLDTLKYLTDRRDGKPTQPVELPTERPVNIVINGYMREANGNGRST